MKLLIKLCNLILQRSLPVRGAWIEMKPAREWEPEAEGRSPYGERGLKFKFRRINIRTESRSPYGERGLKLLSCRQLFVSARSLPVRGAWIEMQF